LGGADDLSREAIETLPAAVYMTDAEGRITFYNEAAAALWGFRPELGKSKFCGSWKLYWPDGTPLPHDQCPMAMALHQRRAIHGIEAIAERPDGTRVPLIPYPTPLFDADGRLTGAINMVVDITERKRAEEALAERESQLAVFVEHAPAAIAMFDREMRYLAVSRRFVVDYHLPPRAQLIGRSHYEVFPNIPQRWRDVHVRVLAGEEVSQDEDQYTRYDGKTDCVRWSMVPWRRANGNIGGALLFADIITEQVEARRALTKSEQGIRELLGALPAAIFVTDAGGRITYYNQAAVELWGRRPQLGKDRWFDLARPYCADGKPAKLADCPTEIALRRGKSVRGLEAILERADGTRIPVIPFPTPLRPHTAPRRDWRHCRCNQHDSRYQ
jgi:PAS domain S-box-containing protein